MSTKIKSYKWPFGTWILVKVIRLWCLYVILFNFWGPFSNVIFPPESCNSHDSTFYPIMKLVWIKRSIKIEIHEPLWLRILHENIISVEIWWRYLNLRLKDIQLIKRFTDYKFKFEMLIHVAICLNPIKTTIEP